MAEWESGEDRNEFDEQRVNAQNGDQLDTVAPAEPPPKSVKSGQSKQDHVYRRNDIGPPRQLDISHYECTGREDH
jgi:hypothetical protein